MGTTVVIEGVKASELPKAWRQRVKSKGNELLTVTIAKRKAAAETRRKPNATFGMWALDTAGRDSAGITFARL